LSANLGTGWRAFRQPAKKMLWLGVAWHGIDELTDKFSANPNGEVNLKVEEVKWNIGNSLRRPKRI
jgi:hypothetical protein